LATVKVGSCIKCLTCSAALLLLCAGCGGISTMQSVSPLMFLLPGYGFVDAHSTNSTNAPTRVVAVKSLDSKMELAQVQK